MQQEQLIYPTVQVITIFVPNFNTRTIKLRQQILSDDWVADCYDLDEKYGLWYTTIEQAQKVLKVPTVTEFKV